VEPCRHIRGRLGVGGLFPYLKHLNGISPEQYPRHALRAEYANLVNGHEHLSERPENHVPKLDEPVAAEILESYGKAFGRAEERGAILGDGILTPYGILDSERGAVTGATAASTLEFDDITRLCLSVAPEHRQNGAWLMNDKTALMLRTLKDSAGNPLWRHSDETLFSKPVHTSEYMPDIGAGAKPIAFGDFSNYWLIELGDMVFRTLREVFVPIDKVGIIGAERVSGVLLRRDAVKVLEIGKEATEA
jgi:HK97 family phage major capsid protein